MKRIISKRLLKIKKEKKGQYMNMKENAIDVEENGTH